MHLIKQRQPYKCQNFDFYNNCFIRQHMASAAFLLSHTVKKHLEWIFPVTEVCRRYICSLKKCSWHIKMAAWHYKTQNWPYEPSSQPSLVTTFEANCSESAPLSSPISPFPILSTSVIQNYSFACGFVWVWNLISDIKKGGCLRKWCWGEYLNRREMKWQEVGNNSIMRSFITCTLLQA
jgi:hypothetical protein